MLSSAYGISYIQLYKFCTILYQSNKYQNKNIKNIIEFIKKNDNFKTIILIIWISILEFQFKKRNKNEKG